MSQSSMLSSLPSASASASASSVSDARPDSASDSLLPVVSDVRVGIDGVRFVLSNTDLCYANAIRRLIQMDIPIVYISGIIDKAFNPTAEHKTINTSPLDNEIIEQRLKCIPISLKHHIIEDFQNWMLEVDVTNDTDTIQVITTEHFKILNLDTQTYLSSEVMKQLFPPYIAPDGHNYFIELVKLRPRISDNIPGEQLTIRCTFGQGTQSENGCFNVTSTIACSPVVDPTKSQTACDTHIQACKTKGMNDDELNVELKNWPLLTGQRFIKQNTFQFVIQSIGIYDTTYILIKACDILKKKFDNFVQSVEDTEADMHANRARGIDPFIVVSPAAADIPNSFDVRLNGEDYTMGNILRYEIYNILYPDKLSYIGFKKFHPHDNHSIVRLAYRSSPDVTWTANHARTDLAAIGRNILHNIDALKAAFEKSLSR